MRDVTSAAIALAFLAGCFGYDDQVSVGIENATQAPRDFELVAWWVGEDEDPVQKGNASGTITAGASKPLFSFLRPCEDRLVGAVVYVGALDNGTTVQWEQPWEEDGCRQQHVSLVLEPERVRFRAAYA